MHKLVFDLHPERCSLAFFCLVGCDTEPCPLLSHAETLCQLATPCGLLVDQDGFCGGGYGVSMHSMLADANNKIG